MATMTRVDSTNQALYTITDSAGDTLTVTVAIDSLLGNNFTFASSGGLRVDGMAMLTTIMYALATGIVPASQTPSY